jgi:N-acetylglucosaminyl-diphospho-decaprenol L-rhamnosyltransferase
VVIVNWNGRQFLPSLLQSIRAAGPAEVILIDNSSSDGSQEYLRGQHGITLIENRENAGFGRAANQGLQITSTPYILLLNVDTQALNGSVELLEQFLNDNSGVGVVAPQLLFPDGKLQPSCRNFPSVWNYTLFLSYLDRVIPAGYLISKHEHKKLRKVDQPMGAVLMMRKSALEQIDWFDPQFSLYMEEIDLCKRMKEAGWEIFYLPEARFIHHAGGSTSQDWERSQKEYFQNVLRYFRKHFSESEMRRFLFLLPLALIIRATVSLVRGQFTKARFYLLESFRILGGAT